MYLSEMWGNVKTYQISKLCMAPLLIKATFLDLDLDFFGISELDSILEVIQTNVSQS